VYIHTSERPCMNSPDTARYSGPGKRRWACIGSRLEQRGDDIRKKKDWEV